MTSDKCRADSTLEEIYTRYYGMRKLFMEKKQTHQTINSLHIPKCSYLSGQTQTCAV